MIKTETNKNVLIFGTDQAGLMTYYAYKNDTCLSNNVFGFIVLNVDDKPKMFEGLNVYDFKTITQKFIKHHKVDHIVIAIQHIDTDVLFHIIFQLLKLEVQIKSNPHIEQFNNGFLNLDQIKPLKIADLLFRSPKFEMNPALMDTYENQIIVITGAAGSIGSALTKQLTQFPFKQLILIDNAESALFNLQQELIQKGIKNVVTIIADIRDKHKMDQLFNFHKPKIVFHAAAYKHVPLMEEHPYEAVKVNIKGTINLADVSIKHGVHKFVLISTDKAVNPTNVMGASKHIAELYVHTLKEKGQTNFIVTRFGNVLASNGSVIPLFEKQIEAGGPLTLTHETIERYFMTIIEACHLIMDAASLGNGNEIFVFDMGKPIRIYDVAVMMIKLSGARFPEDINIKITGLRPGEKVNEELFAEDEQAKSTYHPKIKIAQNKRASAENIHSKIIELYEQSSKLQHLELVALMKTIVPQFLSNNSKFAVLDQKNKL